MRTLLYSCLLCLVACAPKSDDSVQEYVARAHDRYLTTANVQEVMPSNLSIEDSSAFVSQYINNWVEQQLLLKKAELNMPDLDNRLAKEMEDYRASRAVFLYKNEFIYQKLDTNVTDGEIVDYYAKNKHNFELKDFILRMLYFKVNKDAPDLKKLKKQVKELKEDNLIFLEDYCFKYASIFHLKEEEWVYLNDIVHKIPFGMVNPEEYLQKNDFVELEDSLDVHVVKVLEFKVKDGVSPLSLEKARIKKILLNQRRKRLLNQMTKDIYNDAFSHGKIEIIENN